MMGGGVPISVVTLRVRVWIETDGQIYPGETGTVTLRVRVWIETLCSPERGTQGQVTLRVRVWIETKYVPAGRAPQTMSPSA